MRGEDLDELLQQVAAGAVSPAEARERLARLPFADLGFAKLDLHREVRSGLPEAVYAEGKTTDELLLIVDRLLQAQGRVLLTRLDGERAPKILRRFPESRYESRARVLVCGEALPRRTLRVAVLAAGTSDLDVAEEAAVCIEWFGCPVSRNYDVGVAGVHRLLGQLEDLRRVSVVVAVAGMDGALPTLVAGLVSVPVIAVPTSVGYGASFGGLAALLTMLNGCAPGIAVVNIDNGYGAAVLASRIVAAVDAEAREADQSGSRSRSIASP